ncbi:unnamed protein product [Leuciscus chuanchicus]
MREIEWAVDTSLCARLRKPKRPAVAVENSLPVPSRKCAKTDSYGCINWQPSELPEGETRNSLSEKKEELKSTFTRESQNGADKARVNKLMMITYEAQRRDINTSPAPSIDQLKTDWPFLFIKRFLIQHFNTLTGIELESRLRESISGKGRRVLHFFKSQLMRWRKEVRTVLADTERVFEDVDPGLAAILVMMAFFKEKEDSLFLLADVTTTQADAETQLSLPSTPRIVLMGDFILVPKKWMLTLEGEGKVVIESSHLQLDFTSALAVLFGSFYVFNIEYQEEAASTLEFIQRIIRSAFIAKTLERAVFNQLTSFLSLNNQLDVNQSGFKKGHSTETALLSVTEALRIAKAASKSSVLILLDLSAAFDTVNHQILLSTLSSLGITGTSLHWFESYLTGRSFKVAWRGEVSRAHQLTTGVPQGSVLGPLLFSIYTTSLGHIIQAHGFSYHCYADDTQLFLSFQPDDPTVAARVSSCLADISTWMKEHHLQLNLAKTELLVLPANPSLQHDFTIQLESSLITPSRSVRNLGVTFDDQLTFTDHISKTARSCRFALHNIRKIRPFLTEHATQLIVQALVISRLDYCNALLAGLPACATKPLQMIQNAAARLVFNEPKRAHVTPLFISLHWLPLAARIKFKALTLAYRTITGSAPSYFHSLLRVYIPTRHLRSVNERRLVVPSQKATKSLSRTFSFTVPCWWNALSTLIRNAESLTTFKKQLKTNLFRKHLTL